MRRRVGVGRRSRRAGGGAIATATGLLALVALMHVPGSAAAQSITSMRGLGYPVLPVDARAEVLGGLGIGLQGFSAPMTNPAAAAGVMRRGFMVALDNTSRSMELGEDAAETAATRFPLIQLIFPVGGSVLTLGYGGYLDQSWGVTRSGEAALGDGAVRFNERIESAGGLGELQIGVAIPLGEDFAVGAAVGAHMGNQRIQYIRAFDTTAVAGFERFDESFGWGYRGRKAVVGARWDVAGLARLGASATWSGRVRADSTEGRAKGYEFTLPVQVAGGASVYLAPALLAAASARWSGWAGTEVSGLGSVTPWLGGPVPEARDVWELGGGLEWDDPERRQPRSFPVRVGFQYRQLPFTFAGDAPTEFFVGGGLGLRIGSDPVNPLAALDLTVQRGTRTGAGDANVGALREGVWRFGLSLALFGN